VDANADADSEHLFQQLMNFFLVLVEPGRVCFSSIQGISPCS
jgi:hypothetical protein